MIDILKSVSTLMMLLMTGVAAVMPVHGESGGDSPSQLRLVEPPNGEPSTHMIATAGFPAIAASGTEVAVLRTLDAAWESVALDVMRAKGGDILKRFILVPEFYEDGNPDSESARQHRAVSMTEANAYLAEGKFKPLEVLFDQTKHYVPVLELEAHGLRIHYENDRSILQITSLKDARRHLRLEWPARVLPPAGPDGMIQCGVQGLPMKAWTDVTSELIVLNIWNSGGPADGCDLPEEWRVVRLPQ